MGIELPRPTHKDAKPLADFQAGLGRWKEAFAKHSPDKYCEHKAVGLFVEQEVEIVGGFENERLIPNQGLEGTVLIGTWKHQPQSGLFVRAGYLENNGHGSESFRVALQQTGRSFGDWYYEPLTDSESKGLISVGGLIDGLSLRETERALELSKKFNSALEGYDSIVKSRQN